MQKGLYVTGSFVLYNVGEFLTLVYADVFYSHRAAPGVERKNSAV